jgi:hypothetical protein
MSGSTVGAYYDGGLGEGSSWLADLSFERLSDILTTYKEILMTQLEFVSTARLVVDYSSTSGVLLVKAQRPSSIPQAWQCHGKYPEADWSRRECGYERLITFPHRVAGALTCTSIVRF